MSGWLIEVTDLGEKADAWVTCSAPDGEHFSARMRDVLFVASQVAASLLDHAEHGPGQKLRLIVPVDD